MRKIRSDKGNSKYTKEFVDGVRERISTGVHSANIASEMGISRQRLAQIVGCIRPIKPLAKNKPKVYGKVVLDKLEEYKSIASDIKNATNLELQIIKYARSWRLMYNNKIIYAHDVSNVRPRKILYVTYFVTQKCDIVCLRKAGNLYFFNKKKEHETYYICNKKKNNYDVLLNLINF